MYMDGFGCRAEIKIPGYTKNASNAELVCQVTEIMQGQPRSHVCVCMQVLHFYEQCNGLFCCAKP